MFFVAGIGIAVFIEFLLIMKKNKSESDMILTVWMSVIVLHLFGFYLFYTGKIYDVPFLIGVEQSFPLLQGVFLYFYVSYVTKQLPKNRKVLLLHFLPALAVYVYLIPFFLLPPEQKANIYRHFGKEYEWFNTVKFSAYVCSGIGYVTWSALLLRRHGKNIRDQFSDLDKINLRWLQILTFGMGGIWFLVIFFRNDPLVFTGVVIFVFLIGFFGIRQGEIFAHAPLLTESTEQKKKYPKSGLSEEASEKLHQELLKLMSEEILFKKSDLSIDDLATKLDVHPNYLSQVINQRENKNFYDFVNTYRIEEFKGLIAQKKNQQFTLLSLAYDCGFSSKTSFNRCFKKATGKTPSEYVAALSKGSP